MAIFSNVFFCFRAEAFCCLPQPLRSRAQVGVFRSRRGWHGAAGRGGEKKKKNIQCHNRGQKEDWKLMLSVIYRKWWKTSCQKKEKKNLQNSSFSSLWLLNSSGRNQLVWHPELFFLYKCFPRYMEDGVDHTHITHGVKNIQLNSFFRHWDTGNRINSWYTDIW